jgi:hypothetical protein
MFDILTVIPGKKKLTQSGWQSMNAPCCHHRGHKPDKRMRGGIRLDGDHNWTYHCFNCDFKCGFVLGKQLSRNTRRFLQWCGVDDSQINKWNLESLQHKDLIEYVKIKKQKLKVKFKEATLPENVEMICSGNPDHKKFVDYLHSRGLDIYDYPFMITPEDEGRNANRIIVPYTHDNKIVGHISRYLDNRVPKYIKDQQPGYVFGYDLQKPEWEVCLVFEGIFDALSFDGCALTHDTISDEQAQILHSLNRKIIVVPDMDKTGLSIIDRALELGFYVSLPNWGEGIKDANDALLKYGRLPALLSILQSATNNRIKLQMAKVKLDKRLQH